MPGMGASRRGHIDGSDAWAQSVRDTRAGVHRALPATAWNGCTPRHCLWPSTLRGERQRSPTWGNVGNSLSLNVVRARLPQCVWHVALWRRAVAAAGATRRDAATRKTVVTTQRPAPPPPPGHGGESRATAGKPRIHVRPGPAGWAGRGTLGQAWRTHASQHTAAARCRVAAGARRACAASWHAQTRRPAAARHMFFVACRDADSRKRGGGQVSAWPFRAIRPRGSAWRSAPAHTVAGRSPDGRQAVRGSRHPASASTSRSIGEHVPGRDGASWTLDTPMRPTAKGP